MKKIKVKIIDQNTLELMEEGSVGDRIDLSEVVNIDTSNIITSIKNGKEKEYQKMLEEETKRLKELNELEINKALSDKELAHQLELKKKDDEISSIKQSLGQQKIKLEADLKIKEEELATIKEKIKKECELDLLKKEAELKTSFEQEKANLNKQINDLVLEKEQLTYQKSSLSVKLIGESLERYCNKEAELYMENGFLNCTWEKDNKTVKEEDSENGTKADYIFKVYHDESKTGELITSVCLEMKDEDPMSKQKKKDKDYFKRLDENRNKKNLQYALLVSNLEFDNEAKSPIYRVKEYKDMYVVRPNYMMIFLNMVTSLSMKYADLVKNQKIQELVIKNKLDLQKEFEDLKTKYLDDPLDILSRKVEDMLNEAKKVITSATKIENIASEIINDRIASIRQKISKFEIEIDKKYKKFEKLEGE